MKAICKGMLALLFTFILMTYVPALAAQNNTLLFDGKLEQWGMASHKVAAIGDTLYIARPSGLYTYRVGDGEPRQLMDFSKTDFTGTVLPESGNRSSIGILLSGGGALYSLDLSGGMLWRFDQEAAAFTKEALFDPVTSGEREQNIFSGYCMEGGAVYYIAADAMSPIRNLMRLDLKNGKNELVRSGIQLVVPYAPGVLLVGIDTMSPLGSLALLDIQTGSLEEKLKLTGNFRELQYDPATDTIFLSRKGEIYASHAFSNPEAVARIPIVSPESDSALISGGYLAIPYHDGVRIFSTDPKLLTDMPLKIAGQTGDLPMEDFSAANPDVTFSSIDVYPETTMDLVMHMMEGDGAADIYIIPLSAYNLASLYEKGYFSDLADSGLIQNSVCKMYPYIRDGLMRDGKIIAMPFGAWYFNYSYNPKAFEAAGFTVNDVPKTYGELLDFMGRWGTEYAEQYPSMGLIGQNLDTKMYKRVVAKAIIEDRMYTCLRSGEPVTYDTPEMKALLEKLMATDFSVINALTPAPTANDYEMPGSWPEQLFHLSNGASTQAGYTDTFSYMPLSLLEGEQPVVLVDMQALIINPYTQNYDTALKFVEYVAGSLRDATRENFMPGENEPVRQPYIDTTLAWYEEEISKAEAALKEAKEEDKRNIQDALDLMRQEYDYSKQNMWLTTEESISAFRELGPYFMLQMPDPIFGQGANDELNDLFCNRFLDGKISVDQFLKELDQKLRMIELEN